MAGSLNDKQALRKFEKLRDELKAMTPVNSAESDKERQARVDRLKGDWEEFMKYYFPKWCSAPFAHFHKRYAKAVLTNEDSALITRAWARDHAKTTFTQMLVVYMIVNEMFHTGMYVSNTADAAEEMIIPIKIQLESNPRLLHDFGSFVGNGTWTTTKFITKGGITLRSLGRGQKPRGSKNEEKRPNLFIFDDLDDDEMVENPERLEKASQWLFGALMGAAHLKGKVWFIGLGNLLAEDCLMTRLIEKATNHEQIDIYDKDGNPSWKENYEKDRCEFMINLMGIYAQREYFNNPIKPSTVFKKEHIQYKPMRYRDYSVVVNYLDPSMSARKNADHKALISLGLYKGEIHILKVYCDVASIPAMVNWHYDLKAWLDRKGLAAQWFMEEVFWQQILYKDFNEAAKKKGFAIPVKGDKRKKPDKDQRIMSMSGFFERGQVYFNQAEKDNHHMKNLIEQLIGFKAGNTKIKKDGPDALEGGYKKAEELIVVSQPAIIIPRKPNKNRF